jgi:hypothetical protein
LINGFKSHTHSDLANIVAEGINGDSNYLVGGSGSTGYTGGNETRPINYYAMPIIKY